MKRSEVYEYEYVLPPSTNVLGAHLFGKSKATIPHQVHLRECHSAVIETLLMIVYHSVVTRSGILFVLNPIPNTIQIFHWSILG